MENVSKNRYSGRRLVWHKKDIEAVVDSLLSCKNRKDVEAIFDKILTPREINDMGRRHKVLTMVSQGKSYADIMLETSMSSVTVARISTKCGYGFQKSTKAIKPPKRKPSEKRPPLRYKGIKIR